MLEFLYATDLHGDTKKYEDVFNYAVTNHISLIHLGADILPKGSEMLERQKKFVKGFLKNYYKEASKKQIKILLHFGNDDVYTRKKYFDYGTLLDEKEEEYGGYRFLAYGFVPDYPFGLKTACKLDSPGWKCAERYLSAPVDVGPKGFYVIGHIEEYFKNKGTIEEDLSKIQMTPNMVVSIHSPPYGVGLDVCLDGRRVGSQAVYNWILQKQPLLVLCGHIHESPDVTKTWFTKIGETIVVQPGQAYRYFQETKIVKIVLNEQDVKVEML